MIPGERLYQAIIDVVCDGSLEFEDVAAACGFNPEELLDCFDARPNSVARQIYDLLGRRQIDLTASRLGCSGLRVLLLADIYRKEDIRAFATLMERRKNVDKHDIMRIFNAYIGDILQSSYFGAPQLIIEEFISSQFAASLSEACQRASLPLELVERWSAGEPAELLHIAELREIARSIGSGLTPILASFGTLQRKDFLLGGQPIEPADELEKAYDVDIW